MHSISFLCISKLMWNEDLVQTLILRAFSIGKKQRENKNDETRYFFDVLHLHSNTVKMIVLFLILMNKMIKFDICVAYLCISTNPAPFSMKFTITTTIWIHTIFIILFRLGICFSFHCFGFLLVSKFYFVAYLFTVVVVL